MLPLPVTPDSLVDLLGAGLYAAPLYWVDALLPSIHPHCLGCIQLDAHSSYMPLGMSQMCASEVRHTHSCNNSSSCCTTCLCLIDIRCALLVFLHLLVVE